MHHLQCSFEETMSYSRYHPSKGYWWDFKATKPGMIVFLLNHSVDHYFKLSIIEIIDINFRSESLQQWAVFIQGCQ